jgi:hypothetical protein
MIASLARVSQHNPAPAPARAGTCLLDILSAAGEWGPTHTPPTPSPPTLPGRNLIAPAAAAHQTVPLRSAQRVSFWKGGQGMGRLLLSVVVAVVCLGVGGCSEDQDEEGGGNPTGPGAVIAEPPPTPRALFTPVGAFSWPNCFAVSNPVCMFSATLKNVGNGCAMRLEGVVRFFDAFGFQVGDPYRLTFPSQQVIQSGETVTVVVPFVQLQVAMATREYQVAPVWVDTPCR